MPWCAFGSISQSSFVASSALSAAQMLRQAALAACSCKQRLDTLTKSGFAHWRRVALFKCVVLSTNRPKWVMKVEIAAEIAEQFLQRSLLCFEGLGLISCALPHSFSSRYWRHVHSCRWYTNWKCHSCFVFPVKMLKYTSMCVHHGQFAQVLCS